VTVTAAVIETVVRHARAAAPNECCGMLVGGAQIVDEAVRAGNISDRPLTRFLIEPRDHLDALRRARLRGRDVVGFYHSHPNSPASPSRTDIAEATYPGHLFLIVGLAANPPDVRLYRVEAGNFLETPFVTVP
jgi:proteasome lid subunit RPN8/RPN11